MLRGVALVVGADRVPILRIAHGFESLMLLASGPPPPTLRACASVFLAPLVASLAPAPRILGEVAATADDVFVVGAEDAPATVVRLTSAPMVLPLGSVALSLALGPDVDRLSSLHVDERLALAGVRVFPGALRAVGAR